MSAVNTKDLAKELNSLLDELRDEDLSSLPDNEILELRKKLNPYGRTIEGSDKYVNLSITQIHHEYWKKLIITSFIGFLNRMNDEWGVPSGIPIVPVSDYVNDVDLIKTPESVVKAGDKNAIYDFELNQKWMAKRVVVKEFLEYMFQFNPDEHVRSAYRPNSADKSRKPIETLASRIAKATLRAKDKEWTAREETQEVLRKLTETKQNVQQEQPKPKMKTVNKTIIGKDGKKKVVTREVPDAETPSPVIEKLPADLKDNLLTKNVEEMIPAHDLFNRYKTYLTTNYEELRECTNNLYCEKPEFELAVNVYACHDTADDAEKFVKKHKNEVITEVFTVHTGKWCFFDSFKEQRDNTKFFNDQTIVLEEMLKQTESDAKLGADLLKKRVQKEKKKNIILTGEDDQSFAKWRKQNNTLNKMNIEHIGDMVSSDCPDNAIEVPVWRLSQDGQTLAKDKFYSLAERPDFAEKDKVESELRTLASASAGSVAKNASDKA
jgi:hypothetical protein